MINYIENEEDYSLEEINDEEKILEKHNEHSNENEASSNICYEKNEKIKIIKKTKKNIQQ